MYKAFLTFMIFNWQLKAWKIVNEEKIKLSKIKISGCGRNLLSSVYFSEENYLWNLNWTLLSTQQSGGITS